MPSETIEVRSSYVTAERVYVEFRNSLLMSDHSVDKGGTGKGPSPGDMMLAALTASGVLAARRRAVEAGAPLQAVRAAANGRYDRETIDGPMPGLTFAGEVRQRVELFGAPSGQVAILRAALEECAVAQTLRAGVDLDEKVVLRRSGRPRMAGARNEVLWAGDAALAQLPKGLTVSGPAAQRWAAVATDAGPDHALVDVAGAMIGVNRLAGAPGGPSPFELLAAALSTCTAIFVARNAGFYGIPVEGVEVTVRLEADASQDQSVRRMTKTAVLRGDLTDAEFQQCKFFADFCAIGNSLKRGMPIVSDLSVEEADAGRSTIIGGLREVAPPTGADCVDGTCCIP
ncbi:MAG: hypothetical protein JWO33_2617 [Caulobacteraceae bacterium]|nr:hypothetical protein [Caulobacteraceae bacterium]